MKKMKLGVQGVFAISSGVLLLGGFLSVLKDSFPEWKPLQVEFREITLDLAKKEIARENEIVEAKYRNRLAELDARIQSLSDEGRSLNNEEAIAAQERLIAELTQKEYELNQKLSFGKSDLGAFRSKYEFLKNDHFALASDVEHFKKLYEEKFALVQELTPLASAAYDELTAAKDGLKELQKGPADLVRDRDKMLAEMQAWKAEVEKIDPSKALNVVANVTRDLPLLDFIEPKYNLRQIVLNDLPDITGGAKVDRCTTCHLGIADKRYDRDDIPSVYRAHPKLDLYLGLGSPHPIEKFGCTSCHLGRGYGSTFTLSAHSPNSPEQEKEWKEKYGWESMHYWDTPMLPKKNMQAMCVTCHPNTYNLTMAEDLYEGRKIYERRGCHGCHKIEGLSDDMKKVGPSLKQLGAKLNPEWTARWIRAPREFYPETRMPHTFGHQIPSHETFPDMLHHLPEEAVHELEKQHPAMVAEDAVMIDAITTWLFANTDKSFEASLDPLPDAPGDPEIGKTLVKEVNCLACHNLADLDAKGEDYGPDLSKIGAKANQRWIYNWVRDPKKYWPDGNMPNPRLTDEEALHVSAYLATLKDDEFLAKDPIEPSEELLREIAIRYKRAKLSEEVATGQVDAMTPAERKLYVGEESLTRRGCFACHDIAGFEKRPPIGVALNGEGFKAIELFDFGMHKFVHVPHSRHDWIDQKVKQPYIYFLGKVQNPFEQSFYMPWFGFDDKEASQITTFVMGQTGKLPPANYRYPEAIKDPARRHRAEAVLAGAKIMERKNCVGCHPVGVGWKHMDSAEIAESHGLLWVKEAVVAKADPNLPEDRYAVVAQTGSEGPAKGDRVLLPAESFLDGEASFGGNYLAMSDLFGPEPIEVNIGLSDEIKVPLEKPDTFRMFGADEAHIHRFYEDRAMAPPSLRAQGAKVNPEWFFQFLKHVTPIRNHLGALRMPQWEWSDAEATTAVHYFAAAAGEPFPYKTEPVGEYGEAHDRAALDIFGLPGTPEMNTSLKCLSCHPVGDLMPTSEKTNWGPNLYLAKARLKNSFVKSWLKDPVAWAPGSKMPRFFYDKDGSDYVKSREDADREIELLTDMIHHFDKIEKVKVAAALELEFGETARRIQAEALEAEAAAASESSAKEAEASSDEAFADEAPAAAPAAPAAQPAPSEPAPTPAPAPPPAEEEEDDFDN